MTQSQPFWEESYKRQGKLDTFGGGKPSEWVAKIAPMFPSGARALDLGCGEGRNALYLAGLGFQVSATDISPSGIAKLNATAGEQGFTIDASVCDMRKYVFPHTFDLIVCQGCLHLIRRDEWAVVIKRLQDNTSPGGIHVIGVFTDTAPEPEDQRGLMVGLFKEGELAEQYRHWDILEKRAYRFTHTHPDGPTHEHAGNEIIAQKPD